MRPKVLSTRTLTPHAHALLVSSSLAHDYDLIQWDEDRPADREWLLTKLSEGGVQGVVVQWQDLVCHSSSPWFPFHRPES
jgi:hypothetical protein